MASLKSAINAYCKTCVYDQSSPGTWREQVENCGVTKCELYEVRPRTAATIAANRKPRGSKSFELEVEDQDEVAMA